MVNLFTWYPRINELWVLKMKQYDWLKYIFIYLSNEKWYWHGVFSKRWPLRKGIIFLWEPKNMKLYYGPKCPNKVIWAQTPQKIIKKKGIHVKYKTNTLKKSTQPLSGDIFCLRYGWKCILAQNAQIWSFRPRLSKIENFQKIFFSCWAQDKYASKEPSTTIRQWFLIKIWAYWCLNGQIAHCGLHATELVCGD